MRPLSYVHATAVQDAVERVSGDPGGAFLAGGTTLVDLLRFGLTQPDLLVDINDLPLAEIEDLPGGGVRIGAMARMSDVARTSTVSRRFPAISEALLLGASQQLRNMASMGGNLCQRTRCHYFGDGISPCNKRNPGTGCSALEGFNRNHAILGTSTHCIAAHPSDVAVPLTAFDAIVHTMGRDGERRIPIDDFFLAPGDTPHIEHAIERGELITAIEVPAAPVAAGSLYLKYRDRQSYEFALVSVCAALRVSDGTITEVRLALGGVGTKPWRARRAEETLLGAPATTESFTEAANAELEAASVREHNAFKVDFARRVIIRALHQATSRAGGRP